MEERRFGRLVVIAGGVGVLVGAVLAAVADDSRRDLLDRSATGRVALSLLLVGLGAWHFRAWGLGKLIAIGLLAAGAVQLNLFDFGDGDPIWSQGYTGVELVGLWVVIASGSVVLIGVVWSFIEVAGSAGGRDQDVATSVAWWRRWGMLVIGVAVALWVFGQIFAESHDAPPIDTADESDDGRVQDEVWSITRDGDAAGSYIFSMIKTFSLTEQGDVEDRGGRLVWAETEISLCDVAIYSAGDEFVQIGIVSPTTEGCPGMLAAFVDFGVPETACLFVQSGGVDDEYCAPLDLAD